MQWKRKLVGVLSLTLVFAAPLFGCGASTSNGSQNTAGNATGSNSGQKLDIKLSTATTTGVYYPLGAELAKVWNDNLKDVHVSSQASDGSVQNLNLMQQGKIDMAFTTVGVLYDAYNGLGKFKGRPYKDVRVIAALYPNVGQIVARGGSGIQSVADFKGKRFVPGAPGSSTRVLSQHILGAFDMTFNDVKAQYVGFTQAADLMRNKQIDGAIIMAGIPTSAVIEMMSTAHGQLVSLDDAHIQKLTQQYPWLFKYTIPAGTYDGQKQDVTAVAQANMLIVPKSMPEDKVYELTKAMWEHIDEIRQSVAATKNMKLDLAATGLAGVPLDPGAEKYYKEKGVSMNG